MSNVSLKDTKETIFKAFLDAQSQLKAAQAGKVDIKAEVKTQAQATAVAAVKALTVDDIQTTINGLKKDFGGLLTSMSDDLVNQVEKFQNVNDAVAAQEAKLKELFGIEDAAFALVALVNAKEATADEYDARATERTTAAQAQLADLQNQIREAQAQYAKDIQAQKQADQQARDRQKTEWDYDFNRNKKAAQDTLSDELAAKRKVFNAEIEAERNALAKDADAVSSREVTVTAREKNIDDLQAKLAAVPDQIASAVKAAEGKLSGVLASKFESDKALLAAQNEADTKIKENKITTLQEQLTAAQTEVSTLRDQLAKASGDIKDMATATVNAASDSKLAAAMSRTVSELSANKVQGK